MEYLDITAGATLHYMRLIGSITRLRQETLLSLVSIFAIAGTAQMIYGGMWDAISHILEAPEYFWSIQHVAVYTGVAITTCSAALGLVALRAQEGIVRRGVILIVIGALLQVTSGYADSVSHDIFGIDGLVSWSHQPLELGLLISSIGALVILRSGRVPRLQRLAPIPIITVLFSASWLGFSLLLLVGAPIMCLPVYQIFSSGCAVL